MFGTDRTCLSSARSKIRSGTARPDLENLWVAGGGRPLPILKIVDLGLTILDPDVASNP